MPLTTDRNRQRVRIALVSAALISLCICAAFVGWWLRPSIAFGGSAHWRAGNSDIIAVCFAKNDEVLLSLARDGRLRAWNVADRSAATFESLPTNDVALVGSTRDGSQVAVATNDGSIQIINPFRQSRTARIDEFKGRVIDALFFSPSNKLLAGYCEEQLGIWDSGTGEEVARFRVPNRLGRCFTFSSDSELILTGTNVGERIDAWNIGTRQKVREFVGETASETRRFGAIRSDMVGGRFITSSWSGNIVEWDLAIPNALRWMRAHRQGLSFDCLAISSDGSLLITAQREGTFTVPSNVRIWDRNNWRLLKEIQTPRQLAKEQSTLNVLSVAIDGDGSMVAVGHGGGTVSLWSVKHLRHK